MNVLHIDVDESVKLKGNGDKFNIKVTVPEKYKEIREFEIEVMSMDGDWEPAKISQVDIDRRKFHESIIPVADKFIEAGMEDTSIRLVDNTPYTEEQQEKYDRDTLKNYRITNKTHPRNVFKKDERPFIDEKYFTELSEASKESEKYQDFAYLVKVAVRQKIRDSNVDNITIGPEYMWDGAEEAIENIHEVMNDKFIQKLEDTANEEEDEEKAAEMKKFAEKLREMQKERKEERLEEKKAKDHSKSPSIISDIAKIPVTNEDIDNGNVRGTGVIGQIISEEKKLRKKKNGG